MTHAHTPGPWIMRGMAHAEDGADETQVAYGIDPAADGKSGGWPYLVRQDREWPIGQGPMHLAYGIQNIDDARLIAAAPELLAIAISAANWWELEYQNDKSCINAAQRAKEARDAIAKATGK